MPRFFSTRLRPGILLSRPLFRGLAGVIWGFCWRGVIWLSSDWTLLLDLRRWNSGSLAGRVRGMSILRGASWEALCYWREVLE